jgi:hypothetical protein
VGYEECCEYWLVALKGSLIFSAIEMDKVIKRYTQKKTVNFPNKQKLYLVGLGDIPTRQRVKNIKLCFNLLFNKNSTHLVF